MSETESTFELKRSLAMNVGAMVIAAGVVAGYVVDHGWTRLTISLAAFGVIIWSFLFYRLLTIPLVRISGRHVSLSTQALVQPTEFELPTTGEWCYANSYLALPCHDGTACERIATLTDSQVELLAQALRQRGISKVSSSDFKSRDRRPDPSPG